MHTATLFIHQIAIVQCMQTIHAAYQTLKIWLPRAKTTSLNFGKQYFLTVAATKRVQ